jgi:hypothetical protein
MQEQNEPKDYRSHPCYDPKSGVLHGYMCPFCGQIYPTEERAKFCKEMHDDFQVELGNYVYDLRPPWRSEIIVKRVKGNVLIEIGTYTVKKIEVMDENGKVKETIQDKQD